jgi:hypothetical protein
VVCFEHDGERRGTLEFGRWPDDDRLADAADDQGRREALRALVLDFGEWLDEDRAAGCPGHTVELESPAGRIVDLVRRGPLTDRT